jgi:cobalamin biosynthesis protein CbiD
MTKSYRTRVLLEQATAAAATAAAYRNIAEAIRSLELQTPVGVERDTYTEQRARAEASVREFEETVVDLQNQIDAQS